MKKFSGKSEVQPVVDQKKPGVVRNSFRFDDEPEFPTEVRIASLPDSSDMITELARLGAKKLLAEALECEDARRIHSDPVLRGVSTGDMEPTLRALLGEQAKGLSSQSVSRLKMQWKNEFESWSKRSLENKNYVYVWADGGNVSTSHRG